jgi:hypothetical protein
MAYRRDEKFHSEIRWKTLDEYRDKVRALGDIRVITLDIREVDGAYVTDLYYEEVI